MRRRAELWLAVVGVVLLIPLVWLYSVPSLRPGDVPIAFRPLQDIAVGSDLPVPLTVSIPDDPAWKRIRRAWGNPEYVVAVLAPDHNTTLCFNRFDLDVRVTSAGALRHIEDAIDPLYGQSAQCSPIGVKFAASAGELLELQISAKKDAVPRGYLIVVPYWTGVVKDQLVGLAIDEELRGPAKVLAIVGACCLALASCILSVRLKFGSPPRADLRS